MSARTVRQNINGSAIAGMIALVIYVAISALFYKGLSRSILSTGLVYGLATFVVSFLISRIISVSKARA